MGIPGGEPGLTTQPATGKYLSQPTQLYNQHSSAEPGQLNLPKKIPARYNLGGGSGRHLVEKEVMCSEF
jgi:hypothetical protein